MTKFFRFWAVLWMLLDPFDCNALEPLRKICGNAFSIEVQFVKWNETSKKLNRLILFGSSEGFLASDVRDIDFYYQKEEAEVFIQILTDLVFNEAYSKGWSQAQILAFLDSPASLELSETLANSPLIQKKNLNINGQTYIYKINCPHNMYYYFLTPLVRDYFSKLEYFRFDEEKVHFWQHNLNLVENHVFYLPRLNHFVKEQVLEHLTWLSISTGLSFSYHEKILRFLIKKKPSLPISKTIHSEILTPIFFSFFKNKIFAGEHYFITKQNDRIILQKE